MLKKIITADNTETFLNEQVQETYHSQTGAVEEALKKYAIPCKIRELARKIKESNIKEDNVKDTTSKESNGATTKITILDVCSGLGYNSAMAISEALEEYPQCPIDVICLEFDPQIIQKIQEVNPPISFFKHYKRLTPKNLSFKEGNVSVNVILGDARETSKQLPENNFDAIFFDPFSPKTSPEMWQQAFFKEMFRVLKPEGILATFSCARMVRENMAASGLMYDDGPIVGRRGPGTIATKWL
ncbi:MAG TPA: MnmC family methyltransferase [Candidatus Nanoarchaeia archaeon]|nr:MnmC family methyltransferase [Candidatus Nanoarchaeia archaeon]